MAEEEADAAPLAAALAPQAAEPELPAWVHWIWRAWWRLSDERPWIAGGMGPSRPGRIPWTAVAAWCAARGYGEDQEDQLEAGLAAMDEEYLSWQAEQARKAAEEAKRG